MREILFRGKQVDNGEWVEGDFCHPCNIVFEAMGYDEVLGQKDVPVINDYAVIPETVGQYTGLTDKNGKKIFEGDIVVTSIKGNNTVCKVVWADNVAQFQLWQFDTIPHTSTALNLGNYDCEVISNIHDNPALLGCKADADKT